ncbi:hypothetical protein HNR23_004813 [Nocardiopsis mwathae]|uniref:Uncharacterized protein n=1 Tax=Nocardiopsis mwathae TaxID=1472723 RepID=A0A7X0D7R6_9ACTN|nr:hypothetical protein [Nocardiopsis mwathae]MBB6174753.1 hypothetical protein [Nocardiopsis mwathae]
MNSAHALKATGRPAEPHGPTGPHIPARAAGEARLPQAAAR